MTWQTILGWLAPQVRGSNRELEAESVAIKIRWFGLVVGFLLSNFGATPANRELLNIILFLGLIFTAIDHAAYACGRLFLRDFPLGISAMEALFIGLLCQFETGDASPFRFYYFLSLICAAFRYSPRVTFVTCGLDAMSYTIVYAVQYPYERDVNTFLLTQVMIIWVTWTGGAMARWLKQTSDEVQLLNAALQENQTQLETRISERTRELEETQAQLLHQEKMAAFGLLAAGIAHEVGNPLTSISTIVQLLEQRELEPYTRQKLQLVTTELTRIQNILRELITFSRPASDQVGLVSMDDVVTESLKIAKFYKGGKNRKILAELEPDLPRLVGVRGQFVQIVFNLVVNAIDATDKGGEILISGKCQENNIYLKVKDDGIGITSEDQLKLFQPYFTTKKQGTGLGLFVIRRIVEAHHGTVRVESEVGRGTVFHVCFPINAPI
ncbi:MAG: sensor histidine kinase [Fimbriiglobus sp.]